MLFSFSFSFSFAIAIAIAIAIANAIAMHDSRCQVVKDDQVLQNGGLVELQLNSDDRREGVSSIRSINTPIDFDGTPETKRGSSPGVFVLKLE